MSQKQICCIFALSIITIFYLTLYWTINLDVEEDQKFVEDNLLLVKYDKFLATETTCGRLGNIVSNLFRSAYDYEILILVSK